MAEHKDKTTIEFEGKTDPSLEVAGSKAERELTRVEKGVVKVGKALSALDRNVSARFTGMTRKVIGWGVAVTAAAAGFASVREFLEKAEEAADKERSALTTRRLQQDLARNKALQARPKLQQEELERINQQAEALDKVSGYGEGLLRQGMETGAAYQMTSREFKVIGEAAVDVLAKTKGTAATAQDLRDIYQSIAVAATRGTTRGLNFLGFSKQDLIDYKNAHSAFERLLIIRRKMEQFAKGEAEAQAKTAGGEKMRAQRELERTLEPLGQEEKKVEARWITLVQRIVKRLTPYIVPMMTSVATEIEKLTVKADQFMTTWQDPAVKQFWNEFNAKLKEFSETDFWKWVKGQFTLDNIQGQLQGLARELERDLSDITYIWNEGKKAFQYFTGLHKEFERQTKTGAEVISKQQEYDRERQRLSSMRLAFGAFDPRVKAQQEKVEQLGRDLNEASDSAKKLADRNMNLLDTIMGLKDSTDKAIESLNILGEGMWFSDFLRGSGLPGTRAPIPYRPGYQMSDLTGPGGSLAVRYEYDTEGPSSMFHQGKRLQSGAYVGLNPQEMRKYGVREGEYVNTEAGWMKVQESASRRGTIEFNAPRAGQEPAVARGHERLNILGTSKTPPEGWKGSQASPTINYNPTIHIGRLDKNALAELHTRLIDHTRELVNRLDDANAEDYRTSFA